LLDFARYLLFTLKAFTLHLFLSEPRILDPNRSHRRERGQHLQMILSEPVVGQRRIGVDDAKDIRAHTQGHCQY
jgi:hypothetical protein